MSLFHFEVPQLRFGEFDLGGVLYHANYFHVYESAREAFLTAGPVSYSDLVALKCHLAIVESRLKFVKPVRYGEPFTVELSCASIRKASLDIQYRFLRGSEELHRGLTSMVFVQSSGKDFSIQPLPAMLKEYLEKFIAEPLF